MRNNKFREAVDSITSIINDTIQIGVEPLAFAMALRQMADQCDNLAREFEKQEKEQAMKEEEKKDEISDIE